MIMRAAPKTYVFEDVIRARGYGMLFETQIYPFGFEALVQEIREVLGLPVDSPRAIPAGILDRFLRWHGKQIER